MQQEIRKLQTLNDLVSQTLDVLTLLNQREARGGLSHTPYTPEFSYNGGTYGTFSGPYGQGLSGTPTTYGVPYFTPWTQGIPAGFPAFGGGLSHTSYGPGYTVDPRTLGFNVAPTRWGYGMTGW